MGIGCNTKTRLSDLTASAQKVALAKFSDARHHWKQNESASLRTATKAEAVAGGHWIAGRASAKSGGREEARMVREAS